MPKLNQIVAVVNGKKSDAEKAVTAIYQAVQKDTLFNGLTKTYVPLVGEEELPSEKKQLQMKVADAINIFREAMTPLFDVVATQDNANCLAKADIVVDGDHRGEGYGIPTDGMRHAVRLMASKEGLLLDPVYSGKAFAGLLHDIRAGKYRRGDNVLFLMTGGTPGLFASRGAFS